MINPRISADWSATKRIAAFTFTPCVQVVHTKAEVVHLTPGLRSIIQLSCIGNVLRNMINPRISSHWSMNKLIAPFSCTPRVQEVHTKAEVDHLTPGLLGLEVLFNVTHRKCIAKHIITLESLQIGVRPCRLNHSLVHHV